MIPQGDDCVIQQLTSDNAILRRRLAHMTAQYIWLDGGSFGQIDREIREFGYRLVKPDAYSPRIVPVEE